MNDFKIAVFISGNGTNLQSLIDTKFLNNHNSLKISVVFFLIMRKLWFEKSQST